MLLESAGSVVAEWELGGESDLSVECVASAPQRLSI